MRRFHSIKVQPLHRQDGGVAGVDLSVSDRLSVTSASPHALVAVELPEATTDVSRETFINRNT